MRRGERCERSGGFQIGVQAVGEFARDCHFRRGGWFGVRRTGPSARRWRELGGSGAIDSDAETCAICRARVNDHGGVAFGGLGRRTDQQHYERQGSHNHSALIVAQL